MTLELLVRKDSDAASAAVLHQFSLDAGAPILGRGPDSAVPLDDTRISRQHVSFSAVEGRICVTDISSTGVWINDRQMPKRSPVPIEPIDEIRIPGYILSASVKGLEPAPAPAASLPVRAEPTEQPKPSTASPVGSAQAWWKPDTGERWTLYLLAAIGLFFLLYQRL